MTLLQLDFLLVYADKNNLMDKHIHQVTSIPEVKEGLQDPAFMKEYIQNNQK